MNVLSLFDGMSCGQIALEHAEIEYDNYFASEIDKYAIKITQKNYPNTVQLGDVKDRKEWDLPKIDLLIGGSPCQGFSRAGKGLNFDDPQSALFFDFIDILHAVKPKWWLLENVKMKQEWLNIINQYLHGTQPIEINSALVSAQNRKRLYWTNIHSVSQPKDKYIYLQDILEYGHVDKEKSYCIDANYFKGGNWKSYFEKHRRQLVFDKPVRIATIGNGGQGERIYGWRKLEPVECERLQTVPDNYTKGVSNTQRYKMLGNGWTVDVIAHIFKGIQLGEIYEVS